MHVTLKGKMVILHLESRKCHFAYYELLKHVTIELGMSFHKLVSIRVEAMMLARNSRKKSSINVVTNRNAWSSYHCILDHITSTLIPCC